MIEAEDRGNGWARLGRGTSRTIGDGVASWEGGEPAECVFSDTCWVDAVLHERVVLQFKVSGAIFDSSRVLSAFVERTLQSGNIPSVEEIAMEAIAGWVAHREDEWMGSVWLPPHVLPVVDIPDNLVKDGDQTDRVRGRAVAAVHAARISHVRFMIL